MHNPQNNNLAMVGWREWLALPELGIEAIKAKVDTGARTSAIHAYFVEPFNRQGEEWVRFGVHPLQNNIEFEVICQAPVKDRRLVSDSGGHREHRYVIETLLTLNQYQWKAEVTLTDRDSMKFRMLVGRTALNHHFFVDPSASYLQGKPDLR